MEPNSIEQLKASPRNPRTISKHDATALAAGMDEFGDLSCIVFNQRSGQLVGGHQRVQVLKQILAGEKQIVITQRGTEPDEVGTVALGYVVYKNRQFAYRVVDWPEDREIAANIAANRIQGDWDNILLAENDQWLLDNNPELLAKTGQRDDEIARLLGGEAPEKEIDSNDLTNMSFKLTDNQHVIVERAIAQMKAKQSFADEANMDFDGNAIFYICNEWLNAQTIA